MKAYAAEVLRYVGGWRESGQSGLFDNMDSDPE
jgi:hypothetical protein